MVSVLAPRAVDHGFEPRSAKPEDHKIGICCFPTEHAALKRKRANTGLSTDCCFS